MEHPKIVSEIIYNSRLIEISLEWWFKKCFETSRAGLFWSCVDALVNLE